MRRLVFLALVGLAACVPAPEDPLDFGTLCVPNDEDCPSIRLLEREVSGRNQVDYVVRNVGSTIAIVEVVALVPAADLGAEGTIDPDELVARREHEPLAPGEVDENRFTAQDLGVRDAFQLGIRCSGCSVELEWVLASVPRECFEEDDCPAGWQCDDNLGRCAECLVNADCNEDQRCNLETGRCDPPDTTAGCSTVAENPTLPVMLILVLVFAGRRKRHRFAAAAVALATVVAPAAALASPPRASIAVGTGARFVAGVLGPVTKRGVGLTVGQELRWRRIGASLSLGTSYFLTTQEPPPFSRSFHTYGAAIGPRFYLPFGRFEVVAGPDYRRIGVANNSLVRLTGTRTSFDGVGGIGGLRFRWSGLELRIETAVHYLVQLDSTMVGTDLAVGFTNAK